MRDLLADGFTPYGIARNLPPDPEPGEVFLACDLTDLDAVRTAVGELLDSGDFHGLVNNASMVPTSSFFDVTPAEFAEGNFLNQTVPMVLAQLLVPGMQRRGAGRIVNVTSRASLGKAGRSAYSSAKAALHGLTRTWALELAPFAITVNSVAPGPIDTELLQQHSPPGSVIGDSVRTAVPLGRLGQPHEISSFVTFLMSHGAAFMTGQSLHVDGGLTTSTVQ